MENFSPLTFLAHIWEAPQECFTYGSGSSLEPLLSTSISLSPAAGLLGLRAFLLPLWGRLTSHAMCAFYYCVPSVHISSWCWRSSATCSCTSHPNSVTSTWETGPLLRAPVLTMTGRDCSGMTFCVPLFDIPLSRTLHESKRRGVRE